VRIRIAIIGEYDESVRAHVETIPALEHAADHLRLDIDAQWVPTYGSDGTIAESFDAIWMAAGPAYYDLDASLAILRRAREGRIPCLATCRGYQHMVLEFAKNVLAEEDATHQEYSPDSRNPVISRMSNGRPGRRRMIEIDQGTRFSPIYRSPSTFEKFYGVYCVSGEAQQKLSRAGFVSCASDHLGAYRIGGLETLPFYYGCLFVPQLRSTQESPHPLIVGFIQASVIRNLSSSQKG